MRILIDADGCPVVEQTLAVAKEHRLEVYILCDTSHLYEREGAKTITVAKGADSADFRLVNLVREGDIVVTQDYGLAAMCLARRAAVLNQDGMRYTGENIEGLLNFRHQAHKIRAAGGRLRGNAKRRDAQDENFKTALEELIKFPKEAI